MSYHMLSKKLKEGNYRAVLTLNEAEGIELPFNFTVKYKGKKPTIIISNADERIVVDEIIIKGDSVNFKMPVFDTEFKTVLVGDNLEGLWINNYKTTNNKLKFKATYGDSRRFIFSAENKNPQHGSVATDFEGKWETTFSPDTKDSSKAIGVFHFVEQTNFATGTFLTETGDYRYLEGERYGNKLYLSCFDGTHAYLFIATYNDNAAISGTFYAGATWKESWTAKRNSAFKLADAEEITFVKNKDEKINFSFPNLEGTQISLSDKKFENRPVILQLMGSWCPNCMDESKYLSSVYEHYKKEGLEIIALAFERTTDPVKAAQQVKRLKDRFGMNYEILITSKTGKQSASETLPFLNTISAFPTTLFLNREHKVVKVHTGFSGPATGEEFVIFKNRTEALINSLLKD